MYAAFCVFATHGPEMYAVIWPFIYLFIIF